MSISSAMNAGVSGLNANTSRLATISDNIANSSTNGYKRAITDFASIALGETGGKYTAGGVTTTSFRNIQEQGTVVTTSNATDIAVRGRGLLPVTPIAGVEAAGTPELMLVTTGSFQPDAGGYLRTPGGLALLGWPADAQGSVAAQPRDSAAGLEPVRISGGAIASEATENIGFGANLPAAATRAGEPATPLDIGVEYFGNLGTSETLTARFTPQIPGAGQSNTWLLELSDSASGGGTIANFEIEFDDSRSGGGVLQDVRLPGGGAIGTETYDGTTGTLEIAVGGGPLSIQIGRLGQDSQLTQLASDFAPIAITKDGAPAGNLAGLDINERGMLSAVYDTGFIRTLYQVPLADVPNMNGLTSLDNQAFALSDTSGSFYLWDAGDGPTGTTLGFAQEESTTDIAAELTSLIQTQRAYSSNAKVIQTVDEMLQETTNIKR
ncbi:flagellar hook protein FlgE [Pontivivens insulae]|uniref:Flagellar hook protein FlgE n=1 Tax=Pontivivens insulae TaxID=1639689 RepID=A0A2R8A9S7_9RHOB|nr:flagellar hook-basal body complex protein [Pontivivens insulae]RED12794.1 flagellar hook protein FlgE [Pontivivens insulae]SPF28885.1 Flagellar hook protein FlgE [Pontivivens insulae]